MNYYDARIGVRSKLFPLNSAAASRRVVRRIGNCFACTGIRLLSCPFGGRDRWQEHRRRSADIFRRKTTGRIPPPQPSDHHLPPSSHGDGGRDNSNNNTDVVADCFIAASPRIASASRSPILYISNIRNKNCRFRRKMLKTKAIKNEKIAVESEIARPDPGHKPCLICYSDRPAASRFC